MITVLTGDCREVLRGIDAESVHCVVTSPPYWGLRSYKGGEGMIGLEPTFDEHLSNLVDVFREVRRVLRADGTLWLNYGDAYSAGNLTDGGSSKQSSNKGSCDVGPRRSQLPPKNLMMMPARVAMAFQADGWWLRSEIIWHKPNPMPESVTDRPTSAHEKVFLLSKSAKYFYDAEAVRVLAARDWADDIDGLKKSNKTYALHALGHKGINPVRRKATTSEQGKTANLRNVWSIATHSYKGAHFATFPPALVDPCIKAGCPEGGAVLDPFGGAGTVGLVADRLGRDAILIEISEEYADMARKRIIGDAPLFAEVV